MPLSVVYIDLDDFKTGWNSCFDMLISTVEATPRIQVAGEKMAQMAPARAIPQNFLFRANMPPMIAITAITKRGKTNFETFVAEMKGLSLPKYPVAISLFNIARTASQPDRCREPAIILRTPLATAFQGLSMLIFPLIHNGNMRISVTPIPHFLPAGCTKLYTIGYDRTSDKNQHRRKDRRIHWRTSTEQLPRSGSPKRRTNPEQDSIKLSGFAGKE